jgi:hypothetical protein
MKFSSYCLKKNFIKHHPFSPQHVSMPFILYEFKIFKKCIHKIKALSLIVNTYLCYVRFEVFMAVTMKNTIFWDVTLWLSKERSVSIIRMTRIGV